MCSSCCRLSGICALCGEFLPDWATLAITYFYQMNHHLKRTKNHYLIKCFSLIKKTFLHIVIFSLFFSIALIANTNITQEIKVKDNKEEKYNKEAYNETRSRMLWLVEKTWETPDHVATKNQSCNVEKEECDSPNNDAMVAKLNSLIISKVNLEDATISEAIDYLKQKSRELDTEPASKGINIVLKLPPSPSKETIPPSSQQTPIEPLISLQLHEVPICVALDYVARQAHLKIHIDPYAVSLLPLSESTSLFITKEYQIPSHFIPATEMVSENITVTNTALSENIYSSAQQYLQSQGIEFPPGANATIASSGNLIVHNTQDNLDLIDTLVDAAARVSPSQVSIETKFIEISQDHLDQLGFNWLLGPFQIGNSGLEASGGGTINGLNANAYPFPIGGMNPIGNLQAGNDVLNEHSIDKVIENGLYKTSESSSAPGIFSIAGVCSSPQFQLVLRALNQQKGIDLMAAPHVTTKSGVKATVKIIDEFIYPTQYSPPQIPQSTTNSSGGIIHETPPTVAPAFPNSWTTKNLGVTLEAKPTIGPDGYTIDLELHPQITDFDGFINYGTPINTIGYSFSATNGSMVPFSETLTINTINQPVFTVREVNTSVTVCDGQTVVLGGLIREEILKAEDKVPFLGDIPLAGRLFRSRVDKKVKKNLLIFVTPKILQPKAER